MAIERFTQPSKTIPGLDVTFMRNAEGPGYKNENLYWPELDTENQAAPERVPGQALFPPFGLQYSAEKGHPIPLRTGPSFTATCSARRMSPSNTRWC